MSVCDSRRQGIYPKLISAKYLVVTLFVIQGYPMPRFAIISISIGLPRSLQECDALQMVAGEGGVLIREGSGLYCRAKSTTILG